MQDLQHTLKDLNLMWEKFMKYVFEEQRED